MSPVAGGGAAPAEAAATPDWSRLPDDMLLIVMQALEIPDLFSAGAVCSSWRPAYSTARRVRLPINDASPCLLYSSEENDSSTATIYSPSSNTKFSIRLPDPLLRGRYVVGSCHGWIVAADELSNLQALNPITGAQVDLPPATGLYHIEHFLDEQGSLYNHYHDQGMDPDPYPYRLQDLRFFLYRRVFLSCSPAAGSRCVILLMHRPRGQLSFAHLGDERWTRITALDMDDGFTDAVFNKDDGLFYVVSNVGSIYTLDLSGPSPVATKILQAMIGWDECTKYIFLSPGGDIFQLWRFMDVLRVVDVPPDFQEPPDDGFTTCPQDAWRTIQMELYKVDLDAQKLVRINSFKNHALFIGFNSTHLFSTKDSPGLRPGCAYYTDDHNNDCDYIHVNEFNTRDVGIWNFKTDAFESLGDVLSLHPWLNFSSPIWMTPTLT